MSTIRVRRSGLVAFATKVGSTITGLAFVLIVTRNLTPQEFGLWQLIGKTIGYVIFINVFIGFWVTRARARGNKIGETGMIAALVFSLVAVPIYVVASYLVAGTAPPVPGGDPNVFFFLISTPQVLLLTLITVPEAILWGYKPEFASLGFAIFEVSKVALAALTVVLLPIRPHLTGAILAIVGAEIAQLIGAILLSKNEYSDRFSLPLMRTWFRTGWLAVVNNVYLVVITLDYLIIEYFTGSLLPLAFFGAAGVISGVILFGGYLASGLYASILSGKNPSNSTRQVLELQLVFVLPMVAGAIILAPELLSILNPQYAIAASILRVLAVGAGFFAPVVTLENLIAGSDATDTNQKADFSLYLKSKLFLLAKINLFLSIVYIALIFAIAGFSIHVSATYVQLGLLWAVANSLFYFLSFVLKAYYSRHIVRLAVSKTSAIALTIGMVVFAILLFVLNTLFPPRGGAVLQTVDLLLIGVLSLLGYGMVLVTISDSIRQTFRASLSFLLRT